MIDTAMTDSDIVEAIESFYRDRYVQDDEMAISHIRKRIARSGRVVPYRTMLDSVKKYAERNGWVKRDALTNENRPCIAFSCDGMAREEMVEAAYGALTLPLQPGEITAQAVADRMGVSLDTARNRLATMVEAGKLEEVWRKTNKGHGVKAWKPKTNGP